MLTKFPKLTLPEQNLSGQRGGVDTRKEFNYNKLKWLKELINLHGGKEKRHTVFVSECVVPEDGRY